MKRVASILLTGSELLDGRVQDINSRYICEFLDDQTFDVPYIITCGDKLQDITAAIRFLIEQSDTIVICGGLGPTSDDVTREAVAEYFGCELLLNEKVVADIQEIFAKRQRPFYPSNTKQALFPKGSFIIENPIGTAPGFLLPIKTDKHHKAIIALPGVPAELRLMMQGGVKKYLSEGAALVSVAAKKVLRVFGLGEAVIGSKIEALTLPKSIVVSYRAVFPEVHLVFKSLDLPILDRSVGLVKTALGQEFIFSEDLSVGYDLIIDGLLAERGLTIAVAESCTAGLLGALLTNSPGSSRYYLGAVSPYSNSAKSSLLGVKVQALQEHGAVSHVVAKEMAAGVRERYQSDIGLSITGIAGPEGGTSEKPVGTFYVGLSCGPKIREETLSFHCFFSSNRDGVRTFAAYKALDLLRRYILGYPLP